MLAPKRHERDPTATRRNLLPYPKTKVQRKIKLDVAQKNLMHHIALDFTTFKLSISCVNVIAILILFSKLYCYKTSILVLYHKG